MGHLSWSSGEEREPAGRPGPPGGGGQLAEHILLLISLSSGSDFFFFYLYQQFFLTSHAFTSSVSWRLVKMMAPLM